MKSRTGVSSAQSFRLSAEDGSYAATDRLAWIEKGYALSFYLMGCRCREAISVMKEILPQDSPADDPRGTEKIFYRELISKCRALGSSGKSESPKFPATFNSDKRIALELLARALVNLAFNDRLLVLLRDQAGLRFAMIAEILGVPEKSVRRDIVEARLHFRQAVENILKGVEQCTVQP